MQDCCLMVKRPRARASRFVAIGAGLVVLGAGVGAGACSSGRTAPAATATPTKLQAPLGAEAGIRAQTGSDQGSSPHPSPVPGGQLTPAPGSPPVCGESELRLDAGPMTGAASAERQGFVVVLTDIADRPCSLIGYPSVVALNSEGRQERPAARSEGGSLFRVGPPGTVVLQPQHSASFGVEWTAVRSAGTSGAKDACLPYASFVIIPPNQGGGRHVDRQVVICDAFQVHPVVAGTTGTRSH